MGRGPGYTDAMSEPSERHCRLGLATKEVLRLMVEREPRTVVIAGNVHVPEGAVEEWRGSWRVMTHGPSLSPLR